MREKSPNRELAVMTAARDELARIAARWIDMKGRVQCKIGDRSSV